MCAATGATGCLLLVSQGAASTTSTSPSNPRSVPAVSKCTCWHFYCRISQGPHQPLQHHQAAQGQWMLSIYVHAGISFAGSHRGLHRLLQHHQAVRGQWMLSVYVHAWAARCNTGLLIDLDNGRSLFFFFSVCTCLHLQRRTQLTDMSLTGKLLLIGCNVSMCAADCCWSKVKRPEKQ